MFYTEKDIIEIIIKYIKESSASIQDNQDIPINSQLVEQGIIDSIGIFNLILFLEEKFNISIDGDEINFDEFGTIKKISNLILNKLN